jgi:hypothetical protein
MHGEKEIFLINRQKLKPLYIKLNIQTAGQNSYIKQT